MNCFNRKWMKACFSCTCAVVVAFMVGFWFFKYAVEDREIGLVDYPLLKDTKIKFPVASICFEDPFIVTKCPIAGGTSARGAPTCTRPRTRPACPGATPSPP